MASQFRLRTHHRLPIQCPFYYFGSGFVGKGLALNVSQKGWRVCGDCVVSLGMHLLIRLDLPGQSRPIEIEDATVQWVRGKDFGVKILAMKPETEMRLNKFIAVLLQQSATMRFGAFVRSDEP